MQRYGEGLGNLVTCSDVRRIRRKTHGSHCLTVLWIHKWSFHKTQQWGQTRWCVQCELQPSLASQTLGLACETNSNRGGGACVSLNLPNSNETSAVRRNWPHYFTQSCQCNVNYADYDCSRCKFGYIRFDCNKNKVIPRRPARELTDEDWITFIDIIKRSRTYDSGYTAVLEESTPGNASLVMTNFSLYHFYIWIHHLTAKDSLHPDPGIQSHHMFILLQQGHYTYIPPKCKTNNFKADCQASVSNGDPIWPHIHHAVP